MLSNLMAEMARFNITSKDIKEVLSCTERTVTNKLNGDFEFSVDEAMKIRDTFFPGMRIAYLFLKNTEQKSA